MTRVFVLTSILFVLAGCPVKKDPFVVARGTITIARTTTKVANVGFLTAESAKKSSCTESVCLKKYADKGSAYKECLTTQQDGTAEFKTCFAKMQQASNIWAKSYALANAVYDEALAAVDLAEMLKKAKQDQADIETLCLKLDSTKAEEYKTCISGGTPRKADWSVVLKNGACVVYHALDFFPKEYEKYILPVRSMLIVVAGCK